MTTPATQHILHKKNWSNCTSSEMRFCIYTYILQTLHHNVCDNGVYIMMMHTTHRAILPDGAICLDQAAPNDVQTKPVTVSSLASAAATSHSPRAYTQTRRTLIDEEKPFTLLLICDYKLVRKIAVFTRMVFTSRTRCGGWNSIDMCFANYWVHY